jgi:hypothetical protein
MEIWHRVGFGKLDNVDSKLDTWGIKYKKIIGLQDYYIILFDIVETNPRWKDVSDLIQKYNASDIYQTVFNKKEILAAEWLRLIPIFQQGYPQPEETWVSNPITYTSHCPQCGTFQQGSSFRIKKEPGLGKNDFMSMFWMYALFCTPKVLKELETHQIQGYEIWNVIIHNTDLPAQKVSQLYIPAIAQEGLSQVDDLKRQYCYTCQTTKYFPHMKGIMYLKKEVVNLNFDIMQTYEWFGDGHAAYREILISNRLAKLILDQNWKGIALKPVELI